MVIAVQPRRPARQNQVLLGQIKGLGAPPVANQGLRLVATSGLFQSRCERDGTLHSDWLGLTEEGKNRITTGTGGQQGPLGGAAT
ncbi:hypothetical protein WEU32_07340 [Brevundimonas sp. BH3]|uniref:hypothetical protein n=1 Tax=Brevundimonas sp. BH3 TaxID=3133089 RepID=UPI0032502574